MTTTDPPAPADEDLADLLDMAVDALRDLALDVDSERAARKAALAAFSEVFS